VELILFLLEVRVLVIAICLASFILQYGRSLCCVVSMTNESVAHTLPYHHKAETQGLWLPSKDNCACGDFGKHGELH
jgi:hypothetical protein